MSYRRCGNRLVRLGNLNHGRTGLLSNRIRTEKFLGSGATGGISARRVSIVLPAAFFIAVALRAAACSSAACRMYSLYRTRCSSWGWPWMD